jgi:tetratricopeptide (TPR) repeat protein
MVFQSNGIAQRIGNYIEIGRQDLKEGDFIKALADFNQAVYMQPTSYEAYFLRGISKYSLGDYVGAEYDFTMSIEFDPYYSESYHYRAIVRSQQYNFGGALEDFELAIERDKKNAYFLINRARTLLFLKEFQKAIDDCDKALELKFPDENLFIIRGLARKGLKEFEKALEDFNTAVDKNRFNPDGYLQRGGVRMDMEQPDSALADFNRAISLDSLDTQAYLNRALARIEVQDTLGAFKDLNKVLKMSPYNSFAYYNRAIIKIGTDDTEGAISDLDKVLALNPENIAVYLFRGQLKASLGNLKGALADYNKAIEVYPEFADAYYERSQVKKQLMDFKGAEADYKMAYGINQFNFNNDSLSLEQTMYLKKLLAFSGEFYDKDVSDGKIQNQFVDIELKPVFNAVLFATDLSGIKMYDTYDKIGYSVPVINLTEGEAKLSETKVENEIGLLDKKIAGKPREAENYYQKGLLLAQTRDYRNAIYYFDEAIRLDPNLLMAWFCRANTRYKLSELINANNDMDYVFDASRDLTVSVRPIDSVSKAKAYNQIIRDYNKVISLDPDFYFVYFNKGYVRSLTGDYWGAINDFSKAIDLKDDFAEAYYNKGLLLLFMKLNSTGCSNLSRAGEMGIEEAYHVMKRYCFK